MQQIFNFNHVSEKLTVEEINELKAYYKTYHKKCWIYKKAYKKYIKWKLIANSLSILFASGGLLVLLLLMELLLWLSQVLHYSFNLI